MAEGRWRIFHEAQRGLISGNYNLGATNKWMMVLLESAGRSGAANLDMSTTGSLSITSAVNKGDDDAGITKTLAGILLTATASGFYRWSHDAVVFTASVGLDFSAKYAALIYSGVAVPFAICTLSVGASVVANQITVNAPAGGVFTIGNDSASATYTLV